MHTGILRFVLLAGLASSLAAAPAPRAARPEERTILLVDDHDVLYRAGTRRVLNPPARHPRNPVIGDERPYEKTVAYCSVHRDPTTGKYQLWYQAWAGKGAYLCYATSDDGIAWTKPDLGLVAYDGSTRNNIVLAFSGGGSVLHDPRDPDPARRYKALYLHRGLTAAFSPDGIHWKVHPERIFRRYSWRAGQPPLAEAADGPGEPRQTLSDVIDVAFDPVRRVFMAYAKSWIDSPAGETIWRRCVVRLDSGDFLHWSAPRLVAWPDEQDDARLAARGAGGGPDTMAGGGSRGSPQHQSHV
jgi:hypothetical protein